MTNSRCKK